MPDLGGKATVSIPYVLKDGENPKDLTVCYVDYKGNVERFACTYDAATNMVVFETTHFSVYFVTAEKMDEPSTDGSGSLPFAAIGVVAVVLIIGIVAFMRRRV